MDATGALLFLSACFLASPAVSAVGDIAPIPLRTQRAVVQLLSEASVKTCGSAEHVESQVVARGRQISIAPVGADWLAKDPRVSIDIRQCQATTTFNGGAAPVVHTVDLIRDGKITPQGRDVKLQLSRVSVGGVPQFIGYIQAFTLGHASIFATLTERTTTVITCDLNFCDAQAGIPSATPGGCKFV